MNGSLVQNEQWIKRKCHTTEGPYLMPFAPNVNWKAAQVFIVGFNPIAAFRDEFESYDTYWEALTRSPNLYDKVYYAKYQKEEYERSRTSRRIRDFIKQLEPVNVLITNVFSYPSTNPSMIPLSIKQEPLEERIIARLIDVCRPRVLFFHGTVARKFGSSYFRTVLNPCLSPARQNKVRRIPGTDAASLLLAYHHFVGRVETEAVADKRLAQFAKCILSYVTKQS